MSKINNIPTYTSGSGIFLTGTSSLTTLNVTTSSSNTLTFPNSTGTWQVYSDRQISPEPLIELLEILCLVNGIEIDVNEYLEMSKDERISYQQRLIRDIKLKILLDGPK